MGDALSADVTGAIEKLIVASPFGDLIGLECVSVEEDRVQLRLPFRTEVTTLGEMVHGGAIASAVDVAATAAAWASPKASFKARGSTVGFSLNFLAPGLGKDLLADARVIQRGRSLCVVEVSVGVPDGNPVARALVTYRLSLPAEEPA
jgi:uncharacterized protein (TIGR00369 family)